MDERRLVKRARKGDAEAFTSLVRRYERPMYATACSILRSQWDAADAVQEAFAEAYEHLPELRDPDRFKAWLSRIVINKCNQVFRSSSRLILVEDPPEGPAISRGVTSEEAFDLVRAVRNLDEDHRNTVALRYFCDLKIEDIAEIMDCPAGTVKSRLNRALTRLHMTLGNDVVRRDEIQEVAR